MNHPLHRSAARWSRASASATPVCKWFAPKCSSIQPHHPGEKENSQPKLTRQVVASSGTHVM